MSEPTDKGRELDKKIEELRIMKERTADFCREESAEGRKAPWHLVENMNNHLSELCQQRKALK